MTDERHYCVDAPDGMWTVCRHGRTITVLSELHCFDLHLRNHLRELGHVIHLDLVGDGLVYRLQLFDDVDADQVVEAIAAGLWASAPPTDVRPPAKRGVNARRRGRRGRGGQPRIPEATRVVAPSVH
mgnify:CR=1 FL=1